MHLHEFYTGIVNVMQKPEPNVKSHENSMLQGWTGSV